MRSGIVISTIGALGLAGAVLAAQHGYSLDDIERGRMLHRSTCAGRYGPDRRSREGRRAKVHRLP